MVFFVVLVFRSDNDSDELDDEKEKNKLTNIEESIQVIFLIIKVSFICF